MTEKTDQHAAEVHINVDYDSGETTILLNVFKDQILDAVYVLDSVDVYEKTRSTTHRKAMEKEND